MHGKFIAYYRVSTDKQGKSGLGLDAQRKAVGDYLNGGKWELVAEFTEVESGKNNHRPKLAEAIKACRKHKAKLLIAKLDRLSRNVHFISGLMGGEGAKVPFVCCDMPDANNLTINILAAVAEHEREMIAARTKAGLAAAKARGVKLGNPALAVANRDAARDRAEALRPVIEDLAGRGITASQQIANELNAKGIKPPSGNKWHAMTAYRVRQRLGIDASA